MRVFKAKWFARWANAEGLSEADICKAALEAFGGQFEADLGGYLFKKRIARSGGGKSGGYRTILGFRRRDAERIFFLYGFPKNARANISPKEREALGIIADSLVRTNDREIDALKGKRSIVELECGE